MRKISKQTVKVAFSQNYATVIPIDQRPTSCFAVLAGSEVGITGPTPTGRIRIQGAANEEDQARLAQILVSTAEHFTLLDTYLTSGIPYTIRCYSESARGGFAVGARVVAEDVVVDFFAGREPSARFPTVVDQICSQLHRVFGGRIQVLNTHDF